MPRWLGLAIDPTPGGTTLDVLATPGPIVIPDPTVWIPIEEATPDKGFTNTDTNNLGYGVRGSSAPLPFRARPKLTFTTDLFSKAAKLILPCALGVIGTATGTPPVAVKTPVRPADFGAQLPTLIGWLVRDGQTDRMTGLAVDSFTITVQGGVPTLQVSLTALYHESVPTPGTLPTVSYTGFEPDQKYSGVMFKVLHGPELTETPINCIANFSWTFNNNLEDDEDVVFCRGQNVLTTVTGGRYRRRQWPGQHVLGEQSNSGNIGFGAPRQDHEDRQLFVTAERIVAAFFENPLATTPPADRTLRIVIPQQVITGGGADAYSRSDPIKSSYEWSGHIDPATGTDIVAEFVDTAALTLA